MFPGFEVGGVQLRIASIINHFGRRYRHTIIAMNDSFDCRDRLDPSAAVEMRALALRRLPPLALARRIRATLAAEAPDLLLTYNWGAIEWAAVNRLFGTARHIHLESGFGPDEAVRQVTRRVIARRLALARAERLVVPSRVLQHIARETWHIAPEKIVLIPNGVDCARFAAAPDPTLVPGLARLPGAVTVGTVAPLRPEKNLARLLAAVARLDNVRAVIVGDGPERAGLEARARALGIAGRVLFTGYLAAPEKVLGLIDVYALSSDTEQMPNTLIQAMAAGRPVAGTDVGDVRHIVAPDNRPFIAPAADAPFADALGRLAADADLRAALGRANSAHVRAHYDQARMFAAYGALFDA